MVRATLSTLCTPRSESFKPVMALANTFSCVVLRAAWVASCATGSKSLSVPLRFIWRCCAAKIHLAASLVVLSPNTHPVAQGGEHCGLIDQVRHRQPLGCPLTHTIGLLVIG